MEIQHINKKLVSSFLTLTLRRAILYVLRFITINLILAKILAPEVIGIFNIANSILSFFSYFSDIGLGAAIIQKKQLNPEDLKTTFTTQTFLALIIFIIIWFYAPNFASFYNLDIYGVWLIRALGFSFLLSSLKVLPAILLERELRFGPLVLVEVAETTIFCAILIWFSLSNFSIKAFSYATVFQSITGVALIYALAPWRVRVGFSRSAAKTLLNFGVPFQLNSLLALLKDRLVPLVIARMVGSLGVGYITWAQNLAFVSLEIMNIMNRITFPAFSRLQDNKEMLARTLEKALFFTAILMYPVLFGIMAIAPSLVLHVVNIKWLPALPLIYLFSITAFFAALSTPFTNFLNATGKIGITLKLMVLWTVLEWAITPLLTVYYNYFGVAFASALISLTSIIPIIIIKRIVKVNIIKNVWQPLISAALMGGAVYYLSQVFVKDLISLLIVISVGVLMYGSLTFLMLRKKILENIKELRDVSV